MRTLRQLLFGGSVTPSGPLIPDHILSCEQMNRLYRILGLPPTARGGEPIMGHVDRLLDYLEAKMGPNANGGGG